MKKLIIVILSVVLILSLGSCAAERYGRHGSGCSMSQGYSGYGH